MKDSLKHAARNRQTFVRDQPAIAALVAWINIAALQTLANLPPSAIRPRKTPVSVATTGTSPAYATT